MTARDAARDISRLAGRARATISAKNNGCLRIMFHSKLSQKVRRPGILNVCAVAWVSAGHTAATHARRMLSRALCGSALSRSASVAMSAPRALAGWHALARGPASGPSRRGERDSAHARVASRASAAPPVAATRNSSTAAPSPARARMSATATPPSHPSRLRASLLVPRAVSPRVDDHPTPLSLENHPWILLGCDSDAGGALAVIRGPSVGVVAAVDVLDCPTAKVEVNGKQRVRLSVERMVSLVASLNAPPGTVVHLEEGGVEYGFSAQTAFVQGYNFGLWKGVLAAAGLEVRVVKPQAWKWALGLARRGSTKDESRAMAAEMFPEANDSLKRKKDHGRAEALLIAAYGHVAARARWGRDESDAATAETREEDPLGRTVRELVTRTVAERAEAEAEDGGENSEDGELRRKLGPDGPLPYFGPYFGMSGKELKAEAKARGLRVSGRKMELVARLELDDAERRRESAREEEEDGDRQLA